MLDKRGVIFNFLKNYKVKVHKEFLIYVGHGTSWLLLGGIPPTVSDPTLWARKTNLWVSITYYRRKGLSIRSHRFEWVLANWRAK